MYLFEETAKLATCEKPKSEVLFRIDPMAADLKPYAGSLFDPVTELDLDAVLAQMRDRGILGQTGSGRGAPRVGVDRILSPEDLSVYNPPSDADRIRFTPKVMRQVPDRSTWWKRLTGAQITKWVPVDPGELRDWR
ncbi:MAG: hypothetical protein K0R99_931 [Microbacterium sp.]|jgi:hypothetical protein|uniref:hypothetical protein n=1 Tax=Microbacterium sp. TaxID=51671 RepID=UPI0026118369|nr:hypothetical protein [Microbacterium sp.]MDF2559485.1 hypothetical protein [Microbacterium sp.]